MIKHLTFIVLLLTSTICIIAQESDTSVITNTFRIVHPNTAKDTSLVVIGPIISLKTHHINMGNSLMSTAPIIYNLYYTNTGNEPLLITKVRTSCSCTVASYPKTPLQPGGSDKIVLELDAKHKGTFNKIVAIYSNATNNYDSSISCAREVVKINWKVIEIKDKNAIKDHNP